MAAVSGLPSIRLYRLKGRETWNADTRRPDGSRWQFATGKRDEAAAREAAETTVAAEFAGGDPVSEPAPSSAAPPRQTLAEKLRAAKAAGHDSAVPGQDGASDGEGSSEDHEQEPTFEGELLADVLSMAATLGWQQAIARAEVKRRWKDGGKTGYYEPGPPNEKCVEGMQAKLRERFIELFGMVEMTGWLGVGVYATGVAITMHMGRTRVVDENQNQKSRPQPAADGADREEGPPAEEGTALANVEDFRARFAEKHSR